MLVDLASFPASTLVCHRRGPGRHRHRRRRHHHRPAAAITSAGPNNAADVWNRRNLFTYTDGVQITKGSHQISAGVWFQRIQDNEDTASRQLGQATFTSLTTFLQGTVSSFQVVPDPNELGWRSLFGAWYFEDAIKLRPNLTFQAGLRYEFTTGWNEESGRAANYVTGSNGVLDTNPLVGNSVFTQNNATHLLGPRVGLAWDAFGNGKTAVRAGFGTYYSLIDDLSFLLNSLPPYNGSVSSEAAPLPGAGSRLTAPACLPRPAPSSLRRACSPTRRRRRSRNGTSPSSSSSSRNTVLRASLRRLVRISRPSEHRSQHHSRADLRRSGRLFGGRRPRHGDGPGAARRAVHSRTGRQRAESLSGRRLLLVHRRQQQLQRPAGRRDATASASGLQFRANYTWSKNLDMNSALTGAQASNQAQMILDRNDLHRDWGPSAFNIPNSASISGTYELAVRQRPAHGPTISAALETVW